MATPDKTVTMSEELERTLKRWREEMEGPIEPGYAYVETQRCEFRALTLDGALRLWAGMSDPKDEVVRVGSVG